MANSPLFARRRNTETVRDAVMVLGLKRVEAILLGCCLNGIVPSDKWAFDPVIFWRHSLGCALVSRKMAQTIRYSDPEKAYLARLRHDVGILVNSMIYTEQTRSCVQLANDRRIPIHRGEKDLLGFTRCESGKVLAEHWHFSADIIS